MYPSQSPVSAKYHVTTKKNHRAVHKPSASLGRYLIGRVCAHKRYLQFENLGRLLKNYTLQHRLKQNTATMLIPKADRKKIHEVCRQSFYTAVFKYHQFLTAT